MERSYNIFTDGKITYIQLEGIVDIGILKKITEKIWQGKDYKHPCVLWDFRSGVIGFGIEDIQELSSFFKGNKRERGYGRIALVLKRDIQFMFWKRY